MAFFAFAWLRIQQTLALRVTQRMLRKREENILAYKGRQVHAIAHYRSRFLPV